MTFFIVGVPVAVSMLFILYYYVAVTSRTPIHRPHVTSTTLKPTLPHFTFPPEIQGPLDKLKNIASFLSSLPPLPAFPGGHILPGFPGWGGGGGGGGGDAGGVGGTTPGLDGQPPPQYKPVVTQGTTKFFIVITKAIGFKEETAPSGADIVFDKKESALENYGAAFDPDRKERFPPGPVPPGGHFGSLGAPHKPY